MTMMAKQTAYQQNSVNMAPPAELTLRLYKGALRFLNATRQAIEQGNIVDANTYNLRVQDIIRELMVTLKMEYPVAQDFMKMYDYILYRLIQANIHKSLEMLDEVKGYIEEFIEVWTEVMKVTKKG